MHFRSDIQEVVKEAEEICRKAHYPRLIDYAAGKVNWRQTAGVGRKYVAYSECQTPEALVVLEALDYQGSVYAGQRGFYNRAFMARPELTETLGMMEDFGDFLGGFGR